MAWRYVQRIWGTLPSIPNSIPLLSSAHLPLTDLPRPPAHSLTHSLTGKDLLFLFPSSSVISKDALLNS